MIHNRAAHTIESRTFVRVTTSLSLINIPPQQIMALQSQESQIILAIQALQSDEKLSRRKAAAIYSVPETTLRDRMNGRTPRRDYRPNGQKLTKMEEEVIV